jgi:hypothetical protein
MSAEPKQNREEILQAAMEELSGLRQQTVALPDQSDIVGAMEAIDFYETELPTLTNIFDLIEWRGRALADIRHEIAAAEYGFESPEAEAVFDEQDRELTKLLRWIAEQTSVRKVA